MNKKLMLGVFAVSASMCFGLACNALAAVTLPPPPPTSEKDCKKDGWRIYFTIDENGNQVGMFKNQGDCVSFVATNGKNEPDGPAIH